MVSDAVIISVVGAVSSTMALILTLLINKRTDRIARKTEDIESKQTVMHNDINGRITQLLAAKDETIAGKQDLSEATGKAAGIAEKQVEIDKLHKDSPGSNITGQVKEDIVEKTKDAVKEKVEDIKPGDIVGKKKKK